MGTWLGRILWTKAREPAAGAGWRAAAAGGFAVLVLFGLIFAGWALEGRGSTPAPAGFLSEAAGSAGPGRSPATAPDAGSEPSGSEARPVLAPAGPSRWLRPVEGRVLEGYRWEYSDTFRDWRLHTGLDLAATPGAAVVAAAAGRVESADTSRLWDHEVILDLGGGWTAVYRGLGTVSVSAGERVAAGQTIGTVANAVPAEDGEPAHLHWETRRDGKPVDPATLLGP